MTTELPGYAWRGARALVLLHEAHLTEAVAVWRAAKAAGVELPETEDSDYSSLEHLLHHLLRAARGYMVWICEKLELPDPEIRPAPPPATVEAEADAYLEHLLDRWRLPLMQMDEARLSQPSYKSRWGMDYAIEPMLEHAVVHPERHTFQLRELAREQGKILINK